MICANGFVCPIRSQMQDKVRPRHPPPSLPRPDALIPQGETPTKRRKPPLTSFGRPPHGKYIHQPNIHHGSRHTYNIQHTTYHIQHTTYNMQHTTYNIHTYIQHTTYKHTPRIPTPRPLYHPNAAGGRAAGRRGVRQRRGHRGGLRSLGPRPSPSSLPSRGPTAVFVWRTPCGSPPVGLSVSMIGRVGLCPEASNVRFSKALRLCLCGKHSAAS